MSDRSALRTFAFAVVLIAVPLASYLLVFRPRNTEIAEAQSEISMKRTRLTDLARLTQRIGDLGREIGARQDELRRLDEKLPDREGVDAVLQRITEIAAEHDLIVRSVKGEKVVDSPLAQELPLRMTIDGDFSNFYRFLLAIEEMERIARIHSMKLTRPGEGNAPRDPHAAALQDLPEGSMRAEFVTSIYFRPQSAVASNGSKQ
ncbi:MAG: hypothetical protein EXS10_09000 [Phycisphaerales bacterium]|nr:hypothetical protein [Phycisphaerales bacterium]